MFLGGGAFGWDGDLASDIRIWTKSMSISLGLSFGKKCTSIVHVWSCSHARQHQGSRAERARKSNFPALLSLGYQDEAPTEPDAIGRISNAPSDITGRWIPFFLLDGDKASDQLWKEEERYSVIYIFCLPPAWFWGSARPENINFRFGGARGWERNEYGNDRLLYGYHTYARMHTQNRGDTVKAW